MIKNMTSARYWKRHAMHMNKATFADRVREAVRTGQPVRGVTFNKNQEKNGETKDLTSTPRSSTVART